MNGVTPGRVSRGRRGLLLGAGVIGLAGAMRGDLAAAQGKAVLLGEVNVAARETVLAASSTDQSTLRVSNGDRIGVLGQAGDAFDIGEVRAGVCGASSVGAGVYAVGSGDARGLEVRGAVSFETAGLAIIPQGAASWTIGNVRVPTGSVILATLQSYAGRGVGLRYAVRINDERFRITLTGVTTRPCLVAYFIIESTAQRFPSISSGLPNAGRRSRRAALAGRSGVGDEATIRVP